jgi:predicted transcriptional regulator
MSKSLLEMAAEIIQGQVARTSMSSEEIVSSLKSVFGALATMKKAETGDGNLDLSVTGEQMVQAGTAPAKTDPKDSIRDDAVVCLECGAEFKQLTAKHLQTHGLRPREYKKKWGFKLNQSLVARSISKARSKAAKKRGLPAKLQAYLESKRKMKESGTQSTNGV